MKSLILGTTLTHFPHPCGDQPCTQNVLCECLLNYIIGTGDSLGPGAMMITLEHSFRIYKHDSHKYRVNTC